MKVLFLTQSYYPMPKVIEICIINLQKSLLAMGVKSDVIMSGGKNGKIMSNEFGDVYSVGGSDKYYVTKQNKILRLIKNSRFLFTWPIRQPIQMLKYKKLAQKNNAEKNYDAIIASGYPIELALVCTSFKKSILYELDSATVTPGYEVGIKKLFKHRVFQIEKLIYKKAAHIFHLRHNELYYQQKKYNKFSYKSSYVDIPCMIKSDISVSQQNIDQKIICVYAGTLASTFRDPTYLTEIIAKLSEHIDIKCDFYSRGDCENIVKKYSLEYPNVINRMGYVSQEEINIVVEKSDFLLSIGNKLSGQDRSLPSKVIGYIATGKPIIHIDGGDNDSAKNYLNRYGLAIIVNPACPMEDNVRDVLNFISDNRGKRMDFDTIKDLFYENTPEYSAKCIIDVVNNINNKI